MIDYIIGILAIWSIVGLGWIVSYDVDTDKYYLYRTYKPLTIIIGGPTWWFFCVRDFLLYHKSEIKDFFRPRMF